MSFIARICFLFTLVVMMVLASGCELWVSRFVLPNDNVRVSQYKVDIERGVAFQTTDGVTLVADIYRSHMSESAPTILVRIPFSATFKNNLGVSGVGKFWASRGYNVVIQGTRGRYKSGGEYYPLRYELHDGIDTLRWLSKQKWFDGRLGMWGGSAFGYTQWVLADQIDPGPKALMIQIASTNFREMFHPGGAFSLESALYWAVRSGGEKDEDPSFAALERGFNSWPLIEADNRAAKDIPFFNSIP
ncbi:MAG: CocE/NonD family hydrolase [Pseudomonadota bacterium]